MKTKEGELDLCFDKMEYGGAIRDPGLRIVPYVNKGNRITLLNPKSKHSGIQVKHESFNNGIRCTSTITLATEDEAFIIFEANKKPLPDTFKFKIEYLDIYKKKKVSEFKADIEREEINRVTKTKWRKTR